MSDMSELPSTWSYKTTKILVICFVFFIIVPIIGFTTESNSFETLTNPEKSHPSHMMDLAVSYTHLTLPTNREV